MKKRIGFIMPRLIGATVIVGLAALIITTLFKLLLGITLLAGAITMIGRKIGRRRQQWMQGGQGFAPAFSNGNYDGPWASKGFQKAATIVPIN